MKKSATTLAALATLGICASLCSGAQNKINPFIQDKKESFHSFASQLGFDIPPSFYPVHVTNDIEQNGWHYKEYRYYEKNKLNHFSQVYDALLKCSDELDTYLYCYRVTLDPYQVRDWGFFGIGSNSDNWSLYHLKTTVDFEKTIILGPQNIPQYEIINYSPQNTPSQVSHTIGFDVSLGPDGPSATVGASVSFDHSELTVTSGTKVGEPFYRTDYNYRPVAGYTSYMHNSVYCHGMVYFRYRYNVRLVVTHDIQYYGEAYYGINDAGRAILGYNLIY